MSPLLHWRRELSDFFQIANIAIQNGYSTENIQRQTLKAFFFHSDAIKQENLNSSFETFSFRNLISLFKMTDKIRYSNATQFYSYYGATTSKQ